MSTTKLLIPTEAKDGLRVVQVYALVRDGHVQNVVRIDRLGKRDTIPDEKLRAFQEECRAELEDD
jgi:hypothetical protein